MTLPDPNPQPWTTENLEAHAKETLEVEARAIAEQEPDTDEA